MGDPARQPSAVVEVVGATWRPKSTTTPARSGNTLAAQSGASTRDLMARMGHDSPQTMIYQHATAEADGAIAETLRHAA
ncbi:hypothetical protein GCM10027452_25210 [Micromonospora halotolerans]